LGVLGLPRAIPMAGFVLAGEQTGGAGFRAATSKRQRKRWASYCL